MFRFVCVMWWVIKGVKYQTKGYSKEAPYLAAREASTRLVEMTRHLPAKDTFVQRHGQEFYDWGKPTLEEYWINPQAKSPWSAV